MADELDELKTPFIGPFIEHVSAIIAILRAVVGSGIHRTGTYVLTPEERTALQEYTSRIEEIQDEIPEFIRDTYYSYIMNDFHVLGSFFNSISPIVCLEEYYGIDHERETQARPQTMVEDEDAGTAQGAPLPDPSLPQPMREPEADEAELADAIDGVEMGSETAAVIANTCRLCGMFSKNGKTKRCKCKLARYCSKECQRGDWGEHKLVCTARETPESQRAAGWPDGAAARQAVGVDPPTDNDGGPAARRQSTLMAPVSHPHIARIDTELVDVEIPCDAEDEALPTKPSVQE